MAKVQGRILIVDDETDICAALGQLLSREGLTPLVAHNGTTALRMIALECPDALLLDFKMPDMTGLEVLQKVKALDEDLPVILITAYAGVQGAVEAMRAGAHDYLAKPFDHSDVIRIVLRALGERELKRSLKRSRPQQPTGALEEMMGSSEAVRRLVSHVDRVAGSNFSVVILGETGSGKELVARAIHQASLRAGGPFIAVDCGAIPETLLESELFGHEKGAFTGAQAQRGGLFEAARRGTLLLDEISNLPLSSQVKLLRALQEKRVCRLGSTRAVEVDVRVLAASNHDLPTLARSGSFRQDLFFRLNEFTILIPPLRERKEDIVYLAKRFLDLTNAELNKQVRGFSEAALHTLLAYAWPGNVRQLRSTIRRAVLLADEWIVEEHLDILKRDAVEGTAPEARAEGLPWAGLPLKQIVRQSTVNLEREVLLQALRHTRGNKAEQARLLHIDYKTIHSKVKEYGISIKGGEEYG
jgi:two-component system nitrogen regulation response regulator GlnG